MSELVLERLNELRYTVYPFVEDSLIAPLSTDVLLDLHALVYTRDMGYLRLDKLAVNVAETLVTATFTYVPLIGTNIVITVSVPSSAAAWSAIDYYRAQVLAADISLYPVFGKGIVDFAAGRSGTEVLFTDLYIEPACLCIRNKHVVTSMISATAVELSGDVKIMPGYNMTVSVFPGSNTVKLGAIVGEGEGMPCEQILALHDCGDGVYNSCEDLIYRINGAAPDWYGDLLIEGGPGIMITADKVNHKIIIKTPFRACSPGCRE